MGSLYKQKSRDGTPGHVWWVKYYVNGRPVRESTGTEKRTEAERFMKEREGRVAAGLPVLPRADRVRYEEAAADLRRHYVTTGTRNLEEAEHRLAHLDRFFAGRRIAGIGQADATAYAETRHRQGASNSTINRELAVLNRMLRVAYENNKLFRLPVLRKLKERGPRQGFFEDEQFHAVRKHLGPDLQVAVTIAHTYGWRMQSEVLILERRQLDLKAGALRLEVGTTKNDDGRVVKLTAELRAQVTAQIDRIKAVERKTGRIIPYLFPCLSGRRRLGERRRDFRKAWATACRNAGAPGMLRHDFRRTAVRNLVNAGVPERVAMTITGHKTRAVFDRYHIVSPGDLEEATRKLEARATGITSGITAVQGLTPVP